MTDVRDMTRNERIVHACSSGVMYMSTLARILDCPEASIRRSIQELRAEGYYIVLDDKTIRCHGKRQALIAPQDDPSANVGGDDDADYQK